MFATVFVALFVAHQVADHWVQTHHQAVHKAGSAWACSKHVITYTLTAALFLVVVPGEVSWGRAGLGLVVSAGTHYVADRRTPLKWMAVKLGKEDYWDNYGGAYQMDQAWHYFWLFVATLIIA